MKSISYFGTLYLQFVQKQNGILVLQTRTNNGNQSARLFTFMTLDQSESVNVENTNKSSDKMWFSSGAIVPFVTNIFAPKLTDRENTYFL